MFHKHVNTYVAFALISASCAAATSLVMAASINSEVASLEYVSTVSSDANAGAERLQERIKQYPGRVKTATVVPKKVKKYVKPAYRAPLGRNEAVLHGAAKSRRDIHR